MYRFSYTFFFFFHTFLFYSSLLQRISCAVVFIFEKCSHENCHCNQLLWRLNGPWIYVLRWFFNTTLQFLLSAQISIRPFFSLCFLLLSPSALPLLVLISTTFGIYLHFYVRWAATLSKNGNKILKKKKEQQRRMIENRVNTEFFKAKVCTVWSVLYVCKSTWYYNYIL